MKNKSIIIICTLVILCFGIIITGNVSGEEIHESLLFTVSDIVFFSYEDNTMINLYDSSDTLIWNNGGTSLNMGEHAFVTVSEGVYRATGSNKFSALSGDPISNYVVGYYAMDQDGYGASTELYTWVPQLYGHCEFIVFGYHDDTNVTVEYTDTGTDIATFNLNKGEHWNINTLDTEWLHVTADQPVSALTCYDQGYFVPSATGRWSGTEFYTYVSDLMSWDQDLTVIAYNDGTDVEIRDTITDTLVWSGTLNSGEAHVEGYPNGANKYFTITSSKTVTVSVQPWVSLTGSYHQGAYVPDRNGGGIGTDLIGSTLNGGYLHVLAYQNDTSIDVYNSQTGTWIASYNLDKGDSVDANPGNGLWRINSNKPVSAYSGWGEWNADFAPVEFGEVINPLQLEKDDRINEGCVMPGDYINYSICFNNFNDYNVTNVTLVDTLPAEVNVVASSEGSEWHENLIYWNYSLILSEESRCEWLLVQVNENVSYGTSITNYVTIDSEETPPTTRSEETQTCEAGEDTDPPVTVKTIGVPQYGGGYYITTDTLITLTATDSGENASGVKEIHYMIDGQEYIHQGDEISFNFEGDCIHTLEFWSVDNANNSENHTIQDHYVDNTGPEQTVEFGDPKNETFFQIGDNWYTGISGHTPVWINSTDFGCDDFGVGSERLVYEVFWGEVFGDWTFLESGTIFDNDENDVNPNVGEISVLLYMNDSCWHEMHYWCYDLLGNRAPEPEESFLNIDFLVDADAPITTRYYTEIFGDFISCSTYKIISAVDTGCIPGGSGVERIEWKVDKHVGNDVWVLTQSGVVYDNDENDSNSNVGEIEIAISPGEECEHHIYDRAFDRFGNSLAEHKEYIKVDCTPPEIIKTVGDPNYPIIPGEEYCITNETPITFYAEDRGCLGGVGLDTLEYNIWYNGNWSGWIPVEELEGDPLYLTEPCTHYLLIRAVDFLGNEIVDNETFNVDNEPPEIIKTVGDPNITPGIEGPDYWVSCSTPITIDAYDSGCCGNLSRVAYSINGGNWTNITELLPYTFSFTEDCEHILSIVAEDTIGRIVYDNETFYVDCTPPEIIKTVGEPNCTIIPGEEYYITPETPITFYAEDRGSHGGVGANITEFNVWYNGSWSGWTPLEELNGEPLYLTEPCTHYLLIRAVDLFGNEIVDNETFYVDDGPPEIIKTVGDPNIPLRSDGIDYWVNCSTPITIDAYDLGCGGNLTYVGYSINDGNWIEITDMLPYTFSFSEDCEHTLKIVAYDCLNHSSEDNETFYVDCTPPESLKTIEGPHYNASQADIDLFGLEGDEIEYFWLRDNDTWVMIDSQDVGRDPCIVGLDYLHIELWWDSDLDDIVDTQLWEMNTPWGHHGFQIMEDCLHEIRWYGVDLLGNKETEHVQYHRVDSQPPETVKEIGEPQCYNLEENITYVNMTTPIVLNSTDQTDPCAVGVDYIHWEIRRFNGETWELMGMGDENGSLVELTFGEECYHEIIWWAVDFLGNVEEPHVQYHKVDNTPPEIIKTVGEPSFTDDNETWWVTTETPINLTAIDHAEPCAVYGVHFDYRIWSQGDWSDWIEYTGNFTFEEGCTHYLEVRATDCLGNYALDNETFIVHGPSGGVGPYIEITYPEFGSTQSVRTLEVMIYAYDDETSWEDLEIRLWTPAGRKNAPVIYYDVSLDETEDYYVAYIDIHKYQSGAFETLHARVKDEDNNKDWDQTSFYINSTTVHDWWMQEGWNQFSFETVGCNKSVERVMSSIEGSYDFVFYWDYIEGWTSYWTEREENELTQMPSGPEYWVHVTNATGIRWYISLPEIEILNPINGSSIEELNEINGTAWDSQTDIVEVNLKIYYKDNVSQKHYWNGVDAWIEETTYLSCNLEESYHYNWSYDSSGIDWICDETFYIKAYAYDEFGCHESDTVEFHYICEEECISYRRYTTDADFDEGILTGLEHDTVSDQLQIIPGETSAYPTLWVANAGEDSLSKWDTQLNKEIARYHTWFGPLGNHGAWEGPAPSRTCVDADGNVYVANRQFGTWKPDVIKVYTDDWVDRNGDGFLNTSWDVNDDGTISPDEMLPMEDSNSNGIIDPEEITDERVAWATQLPYGGRGRSLAIDLDGYIWAGEFDANVYYKLDPNDGSIIGGPYPVGYHTPYGALVDRYGYLWGASLSSNILKLNTSDPTDYTIYYVPSTYGIALGYDSLGNTLVYLGGNCPYVEFNSSSETYSYPAASIVCSLGVATDSEGNIVAGSDWDGSVAKFAPNGDTIWHVSGQVYSEVRGIVVDSDDNIWAVHRDMSKLCKYNGSDGAYLGVYDAGLYPYTYSDATGLGYMGSVSVGTWEVVFDSEAEGTQFDVVSWNSYEPEGTTVEVKVRSSVDEVIWSPWEMVTNGVLLNSTPNGRYLQILTTMQMPTDGESPILYDLTVEATCAYEPDTPSIDLEKYVWDEELEDWADEAEIMVNDTALFNISIHNDGDFDFDMINVSDFLPAGLDYVNGSADPAPDYISPDGKILSWDLYNLSPSNTTYIEFMVILTSCEQLEINVANATTWYDESLVSDEDDATVWGICEEFDEPPEGSGATIDPDTITVTLCPGESFEEHKNVTTDEIPIGKLDVLFLFDLTGSMGDELDEAMTSSINIMDNISAQVADSAFGVGSFMDYPDFDPDGYCNYWDIYGDSFSGDYAWSLDQDITTNTAAISTAINSLILGYGADGPESYARALYESQFAGWRLGARKIVIIFEDNNPHDCDIGSYGCFETTTGVDPGRDEVAGTSDDLPWADVVADLKAADISVVVVESSSSWACPEIWQYATDETGGIYAELGSTSELPDEIVALVENITATISHLTFEPKAGYEDWFDWTPDNYTDVEGGETVEFNVTITVPDGTPPGLYHTWLMVIGDGSILAVQEQWITVPEECEEPPEPGCIPESDFVAYWKLDGDLTDSIGTKHGTGYGDVASTTGIVSQGYEFDGDGDWVNIGSTSITGLSNWTWAGWVYPTATDGRHVYTEGFVNGGTFTIDISNGSLAVTMFNNWEWESTGVAGVITYNQWNHIAVSLENGGFHAGTLKIYVNGNIVNTSTDCQMVTMSTNTVMGDNAGAHPPAGHQPSSYFNGILDEIAVFNRVLSTSEIMMLYTNGYYFNIGYLCEEPDTFDFGDAPDPTFPTLLANDGARHIYMAPYMGVGVDSDPDGQPTIDADGDDTDEWDDEDGVEQIGQWFTGETGEIDINMTWTPFGGNLSAWVDFNWDGDWDDAGEQIFTDMYLTPGFTHRLVVNIPRGALLGPTYARFRISTDSGLSYTGEASDGEVEDHIVFIEEELLCEPDMDVVKLGRNIYDQEWLKDIDVTNLYDLVEFNITIHNNATCCNLTNISVYDYLEPGLTYNGYFMEVYYEGALLTQNHHYTFEENGQELWWNFTQNMEEVPYCHKINIYFVVEVIDYGDWANYVEVWADCGDSSEYETDMVYVHLISENNPPHTPSNPTPSDDEIDVTTTPTLSWNGGDPDAGDTVTYDVYFGTSSPPPLLSSNQSGAYDPGTLGWNTQYYWMIVAWDNHGASSAGPEWSFTTESEPITETQMGIIPSSETVSVGENFSAIVYIDPIYYVGGWEITLLSFPPGIINASDVIIGSEWSDGFYDLGDINNDNGSIAVITAGDFLPNPEDYPGDNHTACEINFIAMQSGVCTIEIASAQVWRADDMEPMPLNTHSATITIV